jgi:hypothetical protein
MNFLVKKYSLGLPLEFLVILGSAVASNSKIWNDSAKIVGWGGSCLCGDGLKYHVGSLLVDKKESCDSLSCKNGIAMGCAD